MPHAFITLLLAFLLAPTSAAAERPCSGWEFSRVEIEKTKVSSSLWHGPAYNLTAQIGGDQLQLLDQNGALFTVKATAGLVEGRLLSSDFLLLRWRGAGLAIADHFYIFSLATQRLLLDFLLDKGQQLDLPRTRDGSLVVLRRQNPEALLYVFSPAGATKAAPLALNPRLASLTRYFARGFLAPDDVALGTVVTSTDYLVVPADYVEGVGVVVFDLDGRQVHQKHFRSFHGVVKDMAITRLAVGEPDIFRLCVRGDASCAGSAAVLGFLLSGGVGGGLLSYSLNPDDQQELKRVFRISATGQMQTFSW